MRPSLRHDPGSGRALVRRRDLRTPRDAGGRRPSRGRMRHVGNGRAVSSVPASSPGPAGAGSARLHDRRATGPRGLRRGRAECGRRRAGHPGAGDGELLRRPARRDRGASGVTTASLLNNPNADPHAFWTQAHRPPSTVADARLVIVNGFGYDDFMRHLLDASPDAKPRRDRRAAASRPPDRRRTRTSGTTRARCPGWPRPRRPHWPCSRPPMPPTSRPASRRCRLAGASWREDRQPEGDVRRFTGGVHRARGRVPDEGNRAAGADARRFREGNRGLHRPASRRRGRRTGFPYREAGEGAPVTTARSSLRFT